MSAPTQRKSSSISLAYRLVLLILVVAFGAYMLPEHHEETVTLTRGPTAAPAQLPESPQPQPAPTNTPVPRPTASTAPAPTSTAISGDATTELPATSSDLPAITYVLNTNTRRFHLPGCSSISEMKEKNRQTSAASREELIMQGYIPCGRCKP